MHGWQLSKNKQHERLPLTKISFCEIKLVTAGTEKRKAVKGGGVSCWPLSIHHDPVSEVGRWVRMTVAARRDQPKE